MIGRLGLMALHILPPEAAHSATLKALEWGLGGRSHAPSDPRLKTSVFGLDFPSPLGLAAGFDKDARVPDAMLNLGLGFVECGSVTPQPQRGNPKPRIFRLPADQAVINRMGFNNAGLASFRTRLERRARPSGILGVNLGANKDSTDRIADYVTGIETVSDLASYLVINISSPNTPGLRDMQGKAELDQLLSRIMESRALQFTEPPLLVKIAPDLSEADRLDIAEVCLDHKVDGLIVSNTTIGHRENLIGEYADQSGGLSGAPLFDPSTETLSAMYKLVGHRIPLIGVGGVSSGETAYAKICAGASLVQLYTALIYEGPGLVRRILRDLAALLEQDGFETISDAVGSKLA